MLHIQHIPIQQATRMVSQQLPMMAIPLMARVASMPRRALPLNTMANVKRHYSSSEQNPKQETSTNSKDEGYSKEEEEFRRNVQSFWKKVDISAEETANFIKQKDPVNATKNYFEKWWQNAVESAKEKESAYYRQMEERKREYFLKMKEYYEKAAQEAEFSERKPPVEEPFNRNNAKEFGETKWNTCRDYARFDKQYYKQWHRHEKSAKRSVIKVVLLTLFVGWLFAKLGFFGSIVMAVLFMAFTKRIPFWMMRRRI